MGILKSIHQYYKLARLQQHRASMMMMFRMLTIPFYRYDKLESNESIEPLGLPWCIHLKVKLALINADAKLPFIRYEYLKCVFLIASHQRRRIFFLEWTTIYSECPITYSYVCMGEGHPWLWYYYKIKTSAILLFWRPHCKMICATVHVEIRILTKHILTRL